MSEKEKQQAETSAENYKQLKPEDKAYMDGVIDGMIRAYEASKPAPKE